MTTIRKLPAVLVRDTRPGAERRVVGMSAKRLIAGAVAAVIAAGAAITATAAPAHADVFTVCSP